MKSFLYEQILTIDFWKGFLQVLYKQLIFDNRCFLVSGIDLILINVKTVLPIKAGEPRLRSRRDLFGF